MIEVDLLFQHNRWKNPRYSFQKYVFSFNILTGISVGWIAFHVLSFLISLKTNNSSLYRTLTLQKSNLVPLLRFSMVVMLGWFLNFIIALNIGWDILLAWRSASWYTGIFRFLTAFEKNLFKISAFSLSSFIISYLSTSVILLDGFISSELSGLTGLQNCLLSPTSFSFKFA